MIWEFLRGVVYILRHLELVRVNFPNTVTLHPQIKHIFCGKKVAPGATSFT